MRPVEGEARGSVRLQAISEELPAAPGLPCAQAADRARAEALRGGTTGRRTRTPRASCRATSTSALLQRRPTTARQLRRALRRLRCRHAATPWPARPRALAGAPATTGDRAGRSASRVARAVSAARCVAAAATGDARGAIPHPHVLLEFVRHQKLWPVRPVPRLHAERVVQPLVAGEAAPELSAQAHRRKLGLARVQVALAMRGAAPRTAVRRRRRNRRHGRRAHRIVPHTQPHDLRPSPCCADECPIASRSVGQ